MKKTPPLPKIIDELALQPKRTIFPSLKWEKGSLSFSYKLTKIVDVELVIVIGPSGVQFREKSRE